MRKGSSHPRREWGLVCRSSGHHILPTHTQSHQLRSHSSTESINRDKSRNGVLLSRGAKPNCQAGMQSRRQKKKEPKNAYCSPMCLLACCGDRLPNTHGTTEPCQILHEIETHPLLTTSRGAKLLFFLFKKTPLEARHHGTHDSDVSPSWYRRFMPMH